MKESSSARSDDNVYDSFDLREDPSFWKDHNVQVIIRVRPLTDSEVQGPRTCVKQGSSQTITWTGHPETQFTFDYIAGEHVTQEMLFKVAGLPMVENCIGGYNSCMFAYGQTGSGKTHTIYGDFNSKVNSGMTPRVFEYLFTRIQKEREARREEKIQFTCKCSFLEIYNEQLIDLLDPSSNNLQIREETNKKRVYVENLKEIEVTTAGDAINQLIQGVTNRKVASTDMNLASSRSHSVFTCIIESKWVSQGLTHRRVARLNMVDLAGSERAKISGAEGQRLKEASKINKSLSTLGLVIMRMVDQKSPHVPYRDSKLTHLLQESLGGNSKTTIIANISPSTLNSSETLSTLQFAQRAKLIKNHATINEDASGHVLAMRMQNQQLKNEVSRLQRLINGGTENNGSVKWEGFQGSSFSLSQDKDVEGALVCALKREKEKDLTVQALTARTEDALRLAEQRDYVIQSLKMKLKFRESAISRLEGVASGKISAQSHLLKEKEELLEELKVLHSQAERSQEVIRVTMENVRLKEENTRLKSFYEEGEREKMNEQIKILENKLLEALQQKHLHEQNIVDVSQKEAEARETAITLSKENDELRVKLKMLIDDNNKLTQLYEGAVADSQQNISRAEESQRVLIEETKFVQKELEMKRENDNLEKRLLSSGGLDDLVCEPHVIVDGNNLVGASLLDEQSHSSSPRIGEFLDPKESSSSALEEVEIVLSKSSESLLIKTDWLSRNILQVLVEQKKCESSIMKEREKMLERKLTELSCSLSKLTSYAVYFQQREAQVRARTKTASSHLMSKKKELTQISTIEDQTERALSKNTQSEVELKKNISALKLTTIEEHNNYEEQMTKLQKLEIIKKESDKLGRKLQYLDQKAQEAKKMENKLQRELQKNNSDSLLEMKENGIKEFEKLSVEVQESVFLLIQEYSRSIMVDKESEIGGLKKNMASLTTQFEMQMNEVKRLRNQNEKSKMAMKNLQARIRRPKKLEKLRRRISELTQRQKKLLRSHFEKNQRPQKEERKELANMLTLPLIIVTKWFADTRGRKKRKTAVG